MNGVTPAMMERMFQELRDEIARNASQTVPNAIVSTESISIDNGNIVNYAVFNWGNRLHPVPEGWEFPSLTTLNLWQYWFHGDPQAKIRPYKCLKKFDLLKNKSVLAKARGVINAIVRCCSDNRNPANLELVDSIRLYTKGYRMLIEKMIEFKPRIEYRRHSELSFATMYNTLKEMRLI